MPFYVGLDLGTLADFTALAVVEANPSEEELHLRHLERYPLHTRYTTVADAVLRLLCKSELANPRRSAQASETGRTTVVPLSTGPELIVDATGVGVAVTDLLKERGLAFRPVTITGGDAVHASTSKVRGKSWRVPKRDLVAALEVPFHNGSLKVAAGLELWPTLREELLNFKRKIDLKTAHDSYEHWRDSDHDDLVLACALACWWARRGARLPTPTARRPKGAPSFAVPTSYPSLGGPRW
jgi:hypothetical protein